MSHGGQSRVGYMARTPLNQGVSWETGLGSAFQIPRAKVFTEGQPHVPMVRDAHGFSSTCSGVLVGLELQLCYGLQSHKRPANPTAG